MTDKLDGMVEAIIDRVGRENGIDGMDGDSWDRLLVRAALQAIGIEALVRDAEMLDWLESRFADGVHVEGCMTGSWSEADLKPAATVFYGSKDCSAGTIREAIKQAMEASSGR